MAGPFFRGNECPLRAGPFEVGVKKGIAVRSTFISTNPCFVGYKSYDVTDSTILINAPMFNQPGNQMEQRNPIYNHIFSVLVLAAACKKTPMKDAFGRNWNPIYEIVPKELVNLRTKVCFPFFCSS